MDYYQISKNASSEISGHPGLEYIKKVCQSAHKILDVGCGEGTRLNIMLSADQIGWGIDINKKAIALAKKQYPQHHFLVASALNLPFEDNHFDLVYSTFALEHTNQPKRFILELIRVTQSDGQIVILCPNYGAPNRRSPVSEQNPIWKLLIGLIGDFKPDFNLPWHRVTPGKKYDRIDIDTKVEPYLGSLINFLINQNLLILRVSSVWEKENHSLNPRKLFIRLLGQLGIYPFKYWGPQIFLAARKKSRLD